MASESFLFDIWLKLCRSLNVPSTKHRSTWNELVVRHSEPHRHYHTLTHVEAMIATLQRHENSLRSPARVYVAAFFHDAVYDPKAGDNEKQSAELAGAFLREADSECEFIQDVENLILATASHADADVSSDAAWFLDADLQILGAEPEAYAGYAQAIRAEFDFVPESDFRAGRSAVLKSFLEVPQIFRTQPMREALEESARANLTRELASLTGPDYR